MTMSEKLSRYPVRPTKFGKEVHSDGWRSRHQLRRATQTALRRTTKPLLEVGGPTSKGYLSIGRRRLPHGLIISNVEHTKGASLHADVRRLPFKAQSLGGILMQGLTRMPEEIARGPREVEGVPMKFQPSSMDETGNILKLIFGARDGDYSSWVDEEIMGYSLRPALLREARRTIEPHGVFIAALLSPSEIRLAGQLGFELTASTLPDSSDKPHPLEYQQAEFLLTLANMETPAAQLIAEVQQW
jgi:hypothetical protein